MDDLISRQAALRKYQEVCNGIKCGECPFLIKVNTEKGSHLITDCKLEAFLHNLPSAQPDVPDTNVGAVSTTEQEERDLKNENRSLCKLRHKNGNCICVGGFCTAVNDEICKSIRMSYEKGYVDGKTDEVRHGRWENHGSFEVCSVCGEEQYGHDSGRYYCQNCGARMDLDEVTE